MDIVERNRFTNVRDVVHKFTRTSVCGPFPIYPVSGFNAVAFDMEINFSLQQTLVLIAGSLASTVANTGYSDFVALYDQYRIDAVEISCMYGANAFAPGSTSGAQNPVLIMVFDPSDSSVISLSSILQYNNVKVIQLGNQRVANGYTLTVRPTPLVTNAGTPSGVPTSAPWLSKDTPTVTHYGLKMFIDTLGSTSVTIAGTIEFYVKYHLSMRLPQ